MTNLPSRVAGARLARLVAGCLAALVLLSGCTTSGWIPDSPPAAGVGVTQGDLEVRNLLIVTSDRGEGVLMGALFSQTDDMLLSMLVIPVNAADEPGQPQNTSPALPIRTKTLTQTNIKISDPALVPGLTSQLTLVFQKAGTVTVIVPSVSNTHPDFKAAYDQVMAGR